MFCFVGVLSKEETKERALFTSQHSPSPFTTTKMCEKKVFRETILSLSKPVVFHHMISEWEVLKWGIDDWSSVFGDKLLPFRCGVQCCSLQPLWERCCSREVMTFAEFANIQHNPSELRETGKWFYFDYKHLNEWASQDNNALKSVTWSSFGFPEIDMGGSTLWIGSGGAHTPCHYDTYGCNLVAQLYGTKRWVLWPPSESSNMKPTRTPYEESSVYSKWNFNCPLPSDFYVGCKDIYIVEMKPGDVLFVPHHWWHFVECLDTSVSINSWIPTHLDDLSRLDEALVRLTVSQITKDISNVDKKIILNPNEDDVDSLTVCDSTEMIFHCIDALNSKVKGQEQDMHLVASDPIHNVNEAEYVLCSTVEELRNLNNEKCNCNSEERHRTLMEESATKARNRRIVQRRSETKLQKVLNAFCHPDVIQKVREKLAESSNLCLEGL